MKTTTSQPRTRRQYHSQAYNFVRAALPYTQKKLGRVQHEGDDRDQAHISGPELLDGIRQLGCEQFGLLARTVFQHWGITTTDDFGRIVYDLIEQQEMRQAPHDRLSDFFDVYDFEEAFDQQYRIEVGSILRR